jgi:hypothetical protein
VSKVTTLSQVAERYKTHAERQWEQYRDVGRGTARCRQCQENNFTKARNDRWTVVRDTPAGLYCLPHYSDLVVCPVCSLGRMDERDHCCAACEDDYHREIVLTHARCAGGWTWPEGGL